MHATLTNVEVFLHWKISLVNSVPTSDLSGEAEKWILRSWHGLVIDLRLRLYMLRLDDKFSHSINLWSDHASLIGGLDWLALQTNCAFLKQQAGSRWHIASMSQFILAPSILSFHCLITYLNLRTSLLNVLTQSCRSVFQLAPHKSCSHCIIGTSAKLSRPSLLESRLEKISHFGRKVSSFCFQET